MSLTSVPFGCYGSELDRHRMMRLLIVCKPMTVSAKATLQLATTSERTAGQTQPEILLGLTLCAVLEPGCLDCTHRVRMEHERVFACHNILLFPSLDFTLCLALLMELKTPSTSCFGAGSGDSVPVCQSRSAVKNSYLSSSRSSTMASLVIFAGGSSSPPR